MERKSVFIMAKKHIALDEKCFKTVYEAASCLNGTADGRRVYIGCMTHGNYYVFTSKELLNEGDAGKAFAVITPAIQDESCTAVSNLEAVLGSYEARVFGVGSSQSVIKIKVYEGESEDKPIDTPQADIVKDVAKETGLDEETVRDRKKILEDYGFRRGSKEMNRVLRLISKQPKGCDIPKPAVLYVQPKGKGTQKVIKDLLMGLSRHNCMLLEGSKSVGKNVAWETVSWLTNRKIFMVQCGEGLTNSRLFGHTTTDNTAVISREKVASAISGYMESKNPEFLAEVVHSAIANMSPRLKLTPGPVTEALIHENNGYGAILLLDEMNLAEPAVLSEAFNALTDGHTAQIHIDELGNFPVSKDLLIGATQNGCGGGYIGTKEQNAATMSRWCCISVQDHKSIVNLLMTADGADEVDPDDIDRLSSIYAEFKELSDSDCVSDACVNLRGFKRAVGFIADGYRLDDAVALCVINTVQNLEEREMLISSLKKELPM